MFNCYKTCIHPCHFALTKPIVHCCLFSVGPTDCIVEGEVLKLGGPFLQTWQKKHLKLYPNRLEFYSKNRDGQIVKGKGVEVKVVRSSIYLSSSVNVM